MIIELLFAVVLVGAVPLAIARVEPGDRSVDPWVTRLAFAAWPAAVALAVGVQTAPGPIASVLAAPWQLVTALLALAALVAFVRDPNRWRLSRRLASEIALGFLAFGAANATSFAVGFAPLGFAPTIVLLTAVHFHAAGFVLIIAGVLAFDRRPGALPASGVSGVAIGSVMTAAGFVGVPGGAVAGAVLVAVGGLLIGVATLRVSPTLRSRPAQLLAIVAGTALFVSMPLAIVWALGTQLGAPPITLDAMVRTHGAINALAVTVPAAVAWGLDSRAANR